MVWNGWEIIRYDCLCLGSWYNCSVLTRDLPDLLLHNGLPMSHHHWEVSQEQRAALLSKSTALRDCKPICQVFWLSHSQLLLFFTSFPFNHRTHVLLELSSLSLCVCVCVCVCMFMWFMRTQICIMTWVWHRYYKEKVIYEDIFSVPII